MKRVGMVVSSPMTVQAFLLDQISALAREFDFSLIFNPGRPPEAFKGFFPCRTIPLAIERKIAPAVDFQALGGLVKIFRRERFDLIHSITPKAGLLAMIAGNIAGVPRRIHTFTGRVWANSTGLSRKFLKFADMVIAKMATDILIDSPSQRAFLLNEGVLSSDRSFVLGNGSISGVDVNKFSPDPRVRKKIREKLRISDFSCIFLFLGRLNRDKGVLDLARAFQQVHAVRPDSNLVFVGPDEGGMRPLIRETLPNCGSRLQFVEFTNAPQDYYRMADVFCLPSYREGFGSVIIEAAAAGIPSIGTRIYGVTDAIEERESGLLYDPGSIELLFQHMLWMKDHPEKRIEMGARARNRALKLFPKEVITRAVLEFYSRVLERSA